MTNELENFLPDYGDEYERERLDGDDERREGCCFPGQCCMPGPHLRSECHTAEMIRDYEKETTMADPGDYIMPFGKEHKGKRLRDVPIGYLDWALSIDLYPQTRAAIEAYLKVQAEYDQEPRHWSDGREDYTGD